jgi:TolB-like protein
MLQLVRNMSVPSRDVIEGSLDKNLASRAFRNSERMSRFLRFAVNHALSADQAPLKEHLIAENVFDRGSSFDSRTDTIVRVEARRLRSKLKEYYTEEGQDDPMIIELPERGYAPAFRVRLQPSPAKPPSPPRPKIFLAVIGLLSIMVLTVVWYASRLRGARVESVESIVVLPFANLSGNPQDDFVSEGLTEEITGALASIPQLQVVARTSAYQFKGRGEDVRKIGSILGIRNVLEGSVRREGNRIRVTSQLISVRDGMHLWSQTYDSKLGSLLEIEEQITRSIVDALKIRLAVGNDKPIGLPETRNPGAHELYLQGRYFWHKGTPLDVKKSIEYMERAIGVDPKYANAYAGLADALSLWSGFDLEPPKTTRPRMKAAAQTAVQLDDRSAEGHFALGIVLATEWDWAGAEREFRRSIDLKPSAAANRQAYSALCLGPQRRYQEAIAQMRESVAYDPVVHHAYYTLRGSRTHLTVDIAAESNVLDIKRPVSDLSMGDVRCPP